ncbi:hypothetical protein WK03_30060 [Burkholderia cepacia]|nr:hypothetical protein WK03_30060 [Burkholderia cepacia]
MNCYLSIGIELKWKQKIGASLKKQVARHTFCFSIISTLAKRTGSQSSVFDQTVSRSMTVVMRKAPRIECVGASVTDIMISALVQIVACRTSRRTRWRHCSMGPVPVWIAGKQRTAVDTEMLKGKPMRAHVPLLEDANPKPNLRRYRVHVPMHFATITKHDHVGERTRSHDVRIPLRQLLSVSAEVQRIAVTVVCQISTAKIDTLNCVASLPQPVG